jgi:hypothetical protein
MDITREELENDLREQRDGEYAYAEQEMELREILSTELEWEDYMDKKYDEYLNTREFTDDTRIPF